jgi:hypothetical protein
MTYSIVMSSWLLLRDWSDAREALDVAAATAARSRAAAAAAAAGGGGCGGRFMLFVAPITSRIDGSITYLIALVARAPVHLTVRQGDERQR